MTIIIKTSADAREGLLTVTEWAYEEPHVSPGTLAYLWTSETENGGGLHSRGIVEEVAIAERGRLTVQVRLVGAQPQRGLTKATLAPYRNDEGDLPIARLSRKLYWNALNKIANLTPEEAAFVDSHFEAARPSLVA